VGFLCYGKPTSEVYLAVEVLCHFHRGYVLLPLFSRWPPKMLSRCAVMNPYLDHHPREAPIIFSPVPTAHCFIEATVPTVLPSPWRHLSTTTILVAPSPSEYCPLLNKLIYYICILNFMDFSTSYDFLSLASSYADDCFGHSRILKQSDYIKCLDTRRYTRWMYHGRLMRVDGKLARVNGRLVP
jgi:hypothetical protein